MEPQFFREPLFGQRPIAPHLRQHAQGPVYVVAFGIDAGCFFEVPLCLSRPLRAQQYQSKIEQGLAGVEATVWNGFFLPKGTPDAIVQKLSEAASATIDTPSVRERLREIGVSTVTRERRSPDYLQKFVEAEIEKWAVPIRSAGVTAE